MHNKLLFADNASALIGGRNIGDQYFQIDPQAQYADDDVFVVGPTARELAAGFDATGTARCAIPIADLAGGGPRRRSGRLSSKSWRPRGNRRRKTDASYMQDAASGEPLAGILNGELPLVWAHGAGRLRRPRQAAPSQRY